MAKKTDPVLGYGGSSFGEKDDFILNYRPTIDFVEPEQVQAEPVPPSEEPTLDAAKTSTKQIIDGLNQVVVLSDAVQQRIDQRVNSAGGMTVKLDPIKDQAVIAAMMRRFPDQADPTTITYDNYRAVLDCLKKSALPVPGISLADIQQAKSDPLRTDFGGLSNQQGQNRPEISSPANSVLPVDVNAFQKSAVAALFALMLPLIQSENKTAIAEHLSTTPHET